MGIRTRLIAATAAAAMLTAMAGVAAASAASASPTASAPSGAKPSGDKPSGDKPSGDKKGKDTGKDTGKDKDAVVARVAASLHVSVQQLITALNHLKQAMGKGAAKAEAEAAFARELKVSLAQAQKALQVLSSDGNQRPKPGNGKPTGVPEEAVQLLAANLHISADRARQVFTDLDKVSGNGPDIVKDPAFIAIAKGLHITPAQLVAALIAVKQGIGGKPEEKVPGGSPTK